jgi:hypothetical protein
MRQTVVWDGLEEVMFRVGARAVEDGNTACARAFLAQGGQRMAKVTQKWYSHCYFLSVGCGIFTVVV